MKILILGLNYEPEKVGIAVYTTGLAENLVERGHEVRVIAAKPYYPAWKLMDGHSPFSFESRTESGVRVTRVPHYIPARPTCAKRLIHYASFALTSFFPTIWSGISWRPDLVFTVAPSLIAAPTARVAAIFAGARSWLHVQDFEVEAAFATGLMTAEGKLAHLARGFENCVLELFDTVSTISPQMCSKLEEKGIPEERVVEFRNWADIEAIRPMSESSPYRIEWGIATPHVALYSGNIANKQGIEIVVEAAKRLKDRDDLTFVVCGEGPNRANLEQQAEGLTNVQFHDLQPKVRLNDLVNLATIHLLPQKAGAADFVLPSKLINMLASGRPIVATAAPATGLAGEVEGCGIVTPPGDTVAFAGGILRLIEDRQLYDDAASAARIRAELAWSRSKVLDGINAKLIAVAKRGLVPEEVGA